MNNPGYRPNRYNAARDPSLAARRALKFQREPLHRKNAYPVSDLIRHAAYVVAAVVVLDFAWKSGWIKAAVAFIKVLLS